MSQGHLWAARSKQGPRGQSYPLMKYLHPSPFGSTEVTCSMNQMRSGEIEGPGRVYKALKPGAGDRRFCRGLRVERQTMGQGLENTQRNVFFPHRGWWCQGWVSVA